jgi:hypothetical protein
VNFAVSYKEKRNGWLFARNLHFQVTEKIPVESLKVPIGNIPKCKSHLMISPKFPMESLKVPIGKIRRLMGDPGQEPLVKLIPISVLMGKWEPTI